MAFKKTVENFVCEHCGHDNVGTGFTDHCERCLWSKHVDIDPGDRREECGGMMEPVELGSKNNEARIMEKCLKCGFARWSRVQPNDDFEVVLKVAKDLGSENLKKLR